MSPAENKWLMQQAFEYLAQGDGGPFADLMADDFRWVITGKTAWSRAYEGKKAVREQLLSRCSPSSLIATAIPRTASSPRASGSWCSAREAP